LCIIGFGIIELALDSVSVFVMLEGAVSAKKILLI